MLIATLRKRAAKCSNVEGRDGLEALFVDNVHRLEDKPQYGELQKIWTDNVARITGGDKATGEVTEQYPF